MEYTLAWRHRVAPRGRIILFALALIVTCAAGCAEEKSGASASRQHADAPAANADGARKRLAGPRQDRGRSDPRPLPAPNQRSVTVFGSRWCPACRSLERSLKARGVPYAYVDLESARPGSTEGMPAEMRNVVPVTKVMHAGQITWVKGADAAGVERAYATRENRLYATR